MKKIYLIALALVCSAPIFAQQERMLRNSIASEGSDGTIKFLEVYGNARIHLFESEENGKRMIFVRGFVPYRFIDNKKITKDALIYQNIDASTTAPIARLTEDYSGVLMNVITLLKDTVADVGFYVYVDKKDVNMDAVIERQFEKFIKDKKFNNQKFWQKTVKEYDFWGAEMWKGKYFINLCYDEYTLNTYLSDYRLLVIFDIDSIPVAYANKETKINVKFLETEQLNKGLTLKFIKVLDEFDRKNIANIINKFYLN